MDATIKNAPERIYLNLGALPAGEIEFASLHEVTWCADKQDASDIEYVLAALSDAAQAPIYQNKLKRADSWCDCDKETFDHTAKHPQRFDTRVLYAAPVAPAAVAPSAERIHALETMLSGERGQKEIWMERAREWCDKYHELEAAMHTVTADAEALANATDYETLEREHLGDSEKRTGIYAQTDERAAFEKWAKTKNMDLTPFETTFDSDFTSSAWDGWQARATATPALVVLTNGMDRAEFHDKAWSMWHAKALDSALLPKLSIHAIRTLWDVLYDAMARAAAPRATNDPDAVVRLKAICKTLGLENAISESVFSNPEGLFAIFGQMRSKIDALVAQAAVKGNGRADFKWPPLPAFPESFAHVAGHAYFTEHQMQGYANAYGEAVRAAVPQAGATLTDEQREAAKAFAARADDMGEDELAALLRSILAAHPTEQAGADAEDAERMRALCAEMDVNRRGVCYDGMRIWDAMCDAVGDDKDGDGLRAAIDAAMKKEI